MIMTIRRPFFAAIVAVSMWLGQVTAKNVRNLQIDATVLSSGVVSDSFNLPYMEEKVVTIEASEGDHVDCSVSGASSMKATELYLRSDEPADLTGFDYVFDCASPIAPYCLMMAETDTTIYATVRNHNEEDEILSVTCTVTPSVEPIALINGETSINFKIPINQTQLLIMEVNPGVIVECFEPDKYFEVYMRFGQPADLVNYEYDCGGLSLDWCHAADDQGNATMLYVTVEAPQFYFGTTNVTCHTVEPVPLSINVPSEPFALQGDIQVFVVDLEEPSQTITCEAQGEGWDFAFYTRFDNVPNLQTSDYDCGSDLRAPCLVQSMDNTKLYVLTQNLLEVNTEQSFTITCSEVVPIAPMELSIGTMTEPFHLQPGLTRTFILTVDSQVHSNLVCETRAFTGDIDLAMQVGYEPGENDFNCLSGGMSSKEGCNVTVPSMIGLDGRSSTTAQVYASIIGYTDAENVTLVCNSCNPEVAFLEYGVMVWMENGNVTDAVVMDNRTVQCGQEGDSRVQPDLEDMGEEEEEEEQQQQQQRQQEDEEMPPPESLSELGSSFATNTGVESSSQTISVLFSAAAVVGGMLWI